MCGMLLHNIYIGRNMSYENLIQLDFLKGQIIVEELIGKTQSCGVFWESLQSGVFHAEFTYQSIVYDVYLTPLQGTVVFDMVKNGRSLLISPTITIWPVPNTSTGPSTLSYYRVIQVQDGNFTDGQTLDLPYRWLDAFATGLAYRLAMIWRPEMVAALKPLADEAYGIAAQQDTEYVSMYISPQISGYYR